MARVLVVSRNPAMAMGLSATDYEVFDLRPPEFGDWIAGTDDADALILDLENPRIAVAAVTNLRAHAKLAPVLLISTDRPGWNEPEMRQLPAAAVLPLPINKPVLLSALEDLLSEPWAHQTMPPQHVEVTRALQELVLDPADLLSEDDDPAWWIAAPHRADAFLAHHEPPAPATEAEPHVVEDTPGLDPDGAVSEADVEEPGDVEESAGREQAEPVSAMLSAEPVDHVTASEPVPVDVRQEGVGTAPEPTRTEPMIADSPPLSAVPRNRRSTRLPAGATSTSLRDMEALRPTPKTPRPEAPAATAPAPPRRRYRPVPEAPRTRSAPDRSPEPSAAPTRSQPTDPTDDAADLVRRLSRVAPTLYGVPETAEVVVLDAVERTHADAGALMIPDDEAWRVSAGVGLRALEHRFELHGESWIVQQVAQAHKGVIIEESDIAREQLQGAPLASWRHLLAAPIPQIEALLLLARRDDPPFDEGDLTILAALGNEAGPLLAAAVETRSLARTLGEFRDEVDLPR